MPNELRKIFFNAADIAQAIENYLDGKPHFLLGRTATRTGTEIDLLPREGRPCHVSIKPDHLLVRIELNYPDDTHVLDYQIDYDKLLDVTIAYCIKHRIPLPIAGVKRTFREGEKLVLEIVLSDDAASAGAIKTEWTRLRDVAVAG
jgi:hypothetical protein